MPTTCDPDAAKQRWRAMLAKQLLRAAVEVQAQEKRNLSRSNPAPHRTPAPRGEYPRGRTWNLRDSVAIHPMELEDIARELRVQIGYLPGAFYGAVLGMRGWKYLVNTLRDMRPRIAKIFAGVGGRLATGGEVRITATVPQV